MFKIHPKVPECMSDEAKAFIMNCFTPNPDDRATAAELLMDAFLRSHPRKKPKAAQEPDPKDFLNTGESSVTFARIPPRPAEACPDVRLTPERLKTSPHLTRSRCVLQLNINAASLFRSPSLWRTPIRPPIRSTCPLPWT